MSVLFVKGYSFPFSFIGNQLLVGEKFFFIIYKYCIFIYKYCQGTELLIQNYLIIKFASVRNAVVRGKCMTFTSIINII